jgi:hypothetical protein
MVNSGTETQQKTAFMTTYHSSFMGGWNLKAQPKKSFSKGNPPSELRWFANLDLTRWVSLAWRLIILYQTGKGVVNQKAQSSPEPEPPLHAIKKHALFLHHSFIAKKNHM